MDIRGAVDSAVPTNIIAAKAAEVRANKVNWQSYLQGQMISGEDCEFIKRFEMARSEDKHIILTNEGQQCAKTFLNLMAHISKEQTVQYILTLIDDTLQVRWQSFITYIRGPNTFARHCIYKMKGSLVPSDSIVGPTPSPYRFAWVEADGVNCIMAVLSNKCGFQLQYQMVFCIWLLAFSPQMCEFLRRYNVVPALSDILQESVKEKVTRIILAGFRNLLEKSAEKETRQEYALAMIQCKVLKQLENLEQQKYDDEDISEDIKFLLEKLGESVQDLSSFDEYSSELKSGRLEWSPVHKSEKFWRENAVRLNEKNYELLKILTRLLEVSDDPQVLAVAAHDVGEYVRHYPRGKRVIEQLGGKQLVMNHMHHEDQQVRYNALLAVQKLMVHNWYVIRFILFIYLFYHRCIHSSILTNHHLFHWEQLPMFLNYVN
ncbi:UNVERIFIED_CONTAM: hypothetical protein FKN15_064225 [Acipenser sinensis]